MPVETSLGLVDLRIVKFYSKPATNPDESLKKNEAGEFFMVDYVSLCPPGQAEKAVINKRVDKILRATAAHEVQYAIRQIVEPAYTAWKSGNAIPETGTPLAAWAGLNPDHAEVLRNFGINTVEGVRDLSNAEQGKLPLPGLKTLMEMAGRFLAASEKNAQSDELKHANDRIAQLEEAFKKMTGNAAPAPEVDEDGDDEEVIEPPLAEGDDEPIDAAPATIAPDEPAKRGRGRPPKAKPETPAEPEQAA